MATDKREGWLRDLKAGDRVAAGGYGFSQNEYMLGTVARVTPAGTIHVRYDDSEVTHEFHWHGRLKNDGSYRYHNLTQVTPQLLKDMARARLVDTVMYYLDRRNVDVAKVGEMSDVDLVNLRALLRPLRNAN